MDLMDMMGRPQFNRLYPVSRTTPVIVVVAGDPGTGKSTLIQAMYNKQNKLRGPLDNVMRVLPNFYMNNPIHNVGSIIIDTSSSVDEIQQVNASLRHADAIILTYACNQQQTWENLASVWLPRLRSLHGLDVPPVIVVGCKCDLLDDTLIDHITTVRKEVMSKNIGVFEKLACCSAFEDLMVSRSSLTRAPAMWMLPT